MFNDTQKTVAEKTVFSVILALVLATPAYAASPGRAVKEGNREFKEGDYTASEAKFMQALEASPESDIVNYNLGTTLYKNGNYQEALEHFQKVFLSEDSELKKNAHYNLGNTLYQLGLTHEHEGNLSQATASLERSVEQYDRVLGMNEKDEDAQHNKDFVLQELKRIQQMQQQKPQQGQRGQSQDQQQQKNQEQQGQEEQNQSSQSQGQEQNENENQSQQAKQNEGAEQNDDQQANSSQDSQQEEGQGDDEQRQTASAQNTDKLTEREARMLLESYQQGEEPQEQLLMQKMQTRTVPVAKDW